MKLTVFKTIKYYLNVWWATFKLSLSKATTYRIEVVMRFLRGVMLVAIQIIFIQAVIGDSDNIAGWSEDQMYLLSGVFSFINYISWAFFAINHWRIEEKILKGEFDAVLMKPMSSIFSASFPDFFIDEAITAISGVFLILYYVARNFTTLTLEGTVFGVIAMICGFVVWFSLELIFASFDFLQVKNGLREIKKNLTNAGRFPLEIWNPNVRFVFYSLFPIAFVSTVPAGLIAGLFNWQYLVLSVLVTSVLFLVARTFWNLSIRNYASGGN
ncbi:ABC-2 family transporter protein [bacterium]|nr:ABC-2 family transporter protein [bacterium]